MALRFRGLSSTASSVRWGAARPWYATPPTTAVRRDDRRLPPASARGQHRQGSCERPMVADDGTEEAGLDRLNGGNGARYRALSLLREGEAEGATVFGMGFAAHQIATLERAGDL